MKDEQFKKLLNFVEGHRLMVLSTVNSDCLPESAVMGFSCNEKLELFFGTYRHSRKYHNILNSPKVAVVIGWEHGKTLQYEGVAGELTEAELELFMQNQLEKMPSAAKYVGKEEGVFFKVIPQWLRYSDLSVDPWEEIQLNFINE